MAVSGLPKLADFKKAIAAVKAANTKYTTAQNSLKPSQEAIDKAKGLLDTARDTLNSLQGDYNNKSYLNNSTYQSAYSTYQTAADKANSLESYWRSRDWLNSDSGYQNAANAYNIAKDFIDSGKYLQNNSAYQTAANNLTTAQKNYESAKNYFDSEDYLNKNSTYQNLLSARQTAEQKLNDARDFYDSGRYYKDNSTYNSNVNTFNDAERKLNDLRDWKDSGRYLEENSTYKNAVNAIESKINTLRDAENKLDNWSGDRSGSAWNNAVTAKVNADKAVDAAYTAKNKAGENASNAADTLIRNQDTAKSTAENNVNKTRESLEIAANKARETAETTFNTVRENIDRTKDTLRETAEKAVNTAQTAYENAQPAVDKAKETATNAANTAKNTAETNKNIAENKADDIAWNTWQTASKAADTYKGKTDTIANGLEIVANRAVEAQKSAVDTQNGVWETAQNKYNDVYNQIAPDLEDYNAKVADVTNYAQNIKDNMSSLTAADIPAAKALIGEFTTAIKDTGIQDLQDRATPAFSNIDFQSLSSGPVSLNTYAQRQVLVDYKNKLFDDAKQERINEWVEKNPGSTAAQAPAQLKSLQPTSSDWTFNSAPIIGAVGSRFTPSMGSAAEKYNDFVKKMGSETGAPEEVARKVGVWDQAMTGLPREDVAAIAAKYEGYGSSTYDIYNTADKEAEAAKLNSAFDNVNPALYAQIDRNTGLPILNQSKLDAVISKYGDNIKGNSDARAAFASFGWNMMSDSAMLLHGPALLGLYKGNYTAAGDTYGIPRKGIVNSAGQQAGEKDFLKAADQLKINTDEYYRPKPFVPATAQHAYAQAEKETPENSAEYTDPFTGKTYLARINQTNNPGAFDYELDKERLFSTIADRTKDLYMVANALENVGANKATRHAAVLFKADGQGNLVPVLNEQNQPTINYYEGERVHHGSWMENNGFFLQAALMVAAPYLGPYLNTAIGSIQVSAAVAPTAFTVGLPAVTLAQTIGATGVAMIAGAVQNTITSGLTDGDIGKAALVGAIAPAVSGNANQILERVGIDQSKIDAIASAINVTPNQAANLLANTITVGVTGSVLGNPNALTDAATSLAGQYAGTQAQNLIYDTVKSADPKVIAATVNAAGNVANITTQTLINGGDVGEALTNAAPAIITGAAQAGKAAGKPTTTTNNQVTSPSDFAVTPGNTASQQFPLQDRLNTDPNTMTNEARIWYENAVEQGMDEQNALIYANIIEDGIKNPNPYLGTDLGTVQYGPALAKDTLTLGGGTAAKIKELDDIANKRKISQITGTDITADDIKFMSDAINSVYGAPKTSTGTKTSSSTAGSGSSTQSQVDAANAQQAPAGSNTTTTGGTGTDVNDYKNIKEVTDPYQKTASDAVNVLFSWGTTPTVDTSNAALVGPGSSLFDVDTNKEIQNFAKANPNAFYLFAKDSYIKNNIPPEVSVTLLDAATQEKIRKDIVDKVIVSEKITAEQTQTVPTTAPVTTPTDTTNTTNTTSTTPSITENIPGGGGGGGEGQPASKPETSGGSPGGSTDTTKTPSDITLPDGSVGSISSGKGNLPLPGEKEGTSIGSGAGVGNNNIPGSIGTGTQGTGTEGTGAQGTGSGSGIGIGSGTGSGTGSGSGSGSGAGTGAGVGSGTDITGILAALAGAFGSGKVSTGGLNQIPAGYVATTTPLAKRPIGDLFPVSFTMMTPEEIAARSSTKIVRRGGLVSMRK